MKVKELVEKLLEFDEELDVLGTWYDDIGSGLYDLEMVKLDVITIDSNTPEHEQKQCVILGAAE